jgi:translation initiation factor 3 subunit B
LVSPLDSTLLVDGAPIVGLDRREKLLKAIGKAFEKAGFRCRMEDMDMPVDENNQSQGFLFITLDDTTQAEQAASAMDNHAFDKRHTLHVMTFAEVDRVSKVEGQWHDAPAQPFEARVRVRGIAPNQS